jgi:hypothetical protein
MVDLCIDFIYHFFGENYAFVAALEKIYTIEVSVLVEHYLVHRELVEVCVEERYYNRG